jgi:hypothetical protein
VVKAAPDPERLVGCDGVGQALALDGALGADLLGLGGRLIPGREEEVWIGSGAERIGRPRAGGIGFCFSEKSG